MSDARPLTLGGLVTTVVLLVAGALPAEAGAGSGMLKAGDVDLKVLSKPHSSTVIAIDTVTDGCQPGAATERDARVVSFAENTAKPTSAAQMNQVVFDFGSPGAAKSFFADLRKNEERRVECGKTAKAGSFKLSKGPGDVGDARFTVTSNEKVSGVTRKVVAIPILAGSSVTELIFLDWDPGLPATTAVAKKAVDRLS
jgi:hypothetical protein